MLKIKALPLVVTCFLMTACGGGGGSSNSTSTNQGGNTTPNQDMMLKPYNYSVTQLKNHVGGLADQRYDGTKSTASLSLETTQQVYFDLFGDSELGIPDFYLHDISGFTKVSEVKNKKLDCEYGGSASYSVKLEPTDIAKVSVSMSACRSASYLPALTGVIVVQQDVYSDFPASSELFFDNLSWPVEDGTTSLTGYVLTSQSESLSPTYQYQYNYNYKLLQTKATGAQSLVVGDYQFKSTDGVVVKDDNIGEYYDSELGKLTFSHANTTNGEYHTEVALKGDKTIEVLIGYNQVKYQEDSDGDGQVDMGAYLGSELTLISGDLSSIVLASLDQLSQPPEVGQPYFVNYYDVYTSDSIQVSPGYVIDPDSDESELTYSYNWYINDELLEDNHTDRLEPFTVVYGDIVKVTMVVSDGTSTIESDAIRIDISDAPAILTISDSPSYIEVGETLQFTATITDPDITDDDGAAATLLSGPSGATVSAQGVVTWTPAADLLFSTQEFEFVFASAAAPDGEFVKTITVKSNTPHPLVRSNRSVPSYNKSMWSGDFDGDGDNEILATDSNRVVYLLSQDEDGYKQVWLYPYALPTQGPIIQVRPVQYDNDSELEILVATSRGFSLIDGLDSMAEEILALEGHIYSFDVRDLNNDGKDELIYVHSHNEHEYSTFDLDVVALDNPTQPLFKLFDVSSSYDFAIGNTDDDSQLEIIVADGRIYDGANYQNEWLSSSTFGSYVTAGDFDGDGVDEIAGAASWGSVTIFSADDKTQLDSFDNFNTCSIIAGNIDDDNQDELLVGDCQWGNVTAYDLTDNKLTSKWALDMQSHGSKSVAYGDIDNDGAPEVFWGTGQSHSGENMFVVADLSNNSAVINQTSIETQLDSYSSMGWASTDGNNDRAVFFIPRTSNGYNGSRLLTMDSKGHYELSNEISSNWDGSQHATVTDFDNDGIGDAFLPTTSTYDGSVGVIELADYSEIWSLSGDYYSNIGVIMAFDANNDGFDDMAYVDGSALKVVDVTNQVFLTNHNMDSTIRDIGFYHTNNTYAVISTENTTTLFRVTGTGLSEVSQVAKPCMRIELVNFDDDAKPELACLEAQDYWSSVGSIINIFELSNDEFSLSEKLEFQFTILDIHPDHSKTNNQALLLATQVGDEHDFSNSDVKYQLRRLNHQGQIDFSSAPLLGKPTSRGIKTRLVEDNLEIMLSTSSVMYWFK
ncbi:hypothetical protein GCM10011369_13540 [Neiella marina]|uniref:VCBS repeat-containing protein n=1 Tax=Neiella marina TaxID=508461 RepID=A0A8J2XNL2_9GAMM|nr:VCBS repeat-containing protein [Neiella marina]GGA73113.1 hypothetical protein GCM10011369_13540 [Neiella marina]